MELVGHDFFLYQDANTGKPSVVYRRKAYNYGVIHLNVAPLNTFCGGPVPADGPATVLCCLRAG